MRSRPELDVPKGGLRCFQPSTIGWSRQLDAPQWRLAWRWLWHCRTRAGIDETKYPDWSGQWRSRPGVSIQWDPTKPLGRGQQAPLTAGISGAVWASLADRRKAGRARTRLHLHSARHAADHDDRLPAEFVILPKIPTSISKNYMPRRILTRDGGFPTSEEPSLMATPIGQWLDTDGEMAATTRSRSRPASQGPAHIRDHRPSDAQGQQTVARKRITLDKSNPDIRSQITTSTMRSPVPGR